MSTDPTQLDICREIIDAAREVFSAMLMMEITGEALSVSGRGIVQSNITSMIGLGGGIRGILAIHCPKGVATSITSGFLGMDVAEIDDDVKDAIGEIANMIAGNLKVAFAGAGIPVELAIPTTVVGEAFRLTGISGASRHYVSFNIEHGNFWAELLYVRS